MLQAKKPATGLDTLLPGENCTWCKLRVKNSFLNILLLTLTSVNNIPATTVIRKHLLIVLTINKSSRHTSKSKMAERNMILIVSDGSISVIVSNEYWNLRHIR